MQVIKLMLRSWRKQLSPKRGLSVWKKQLQDWRRFCQSYEDYQKLAPPYKQADSKNFYPCLKDATTETKIEPTYFYQDSWAFEKIVKQSPSSHIDVGSNHKYVALLSKVVPVTMVDIRPLSLSLDSLQFKQGSIVDLPFADSSIDSLSSLCVIEHIGLGRYGDPIDPDGTEKAINELCRVLSSNGNLYLSLPIDDYNKVFFNAHRALSEEYFKGLISPLKIIEKKHIKGNFYLSEKPKGFNIGCYHLKSDI